MSQGEARGLRRELDRIAGRRGPCFPSELKRRAAEWMVERRAAGATVAELSVELGLSVGTVLKWSSQLKRRRALVPVQIVPDVSERPVSIVSPSGFRLEGLSVTEAAALLRALG